MSLLGYCHMRGLNLGTHSKGHKNYVLAIKRFKYQSAKP